MECNISNDVFHYEFYDVLEEITSQRFGAYDILHSWLDSPDNTEGTNYFGNFFDEQMTLKLNDRIAAGDCSVLDILTRDEYVAASRELTYEMYNFYKSISYSMKKDCLFYDENDFLVDEDGNYVEEICDYDYIHFE